MSYVYEFLENSGGMARYSSRKSGSFEAGFSFDDLFLLVHFVVDINRVQAPHNVEVVRLPLAGPTLSLASMEGADGLRAAGADTGRLLAASHCRLRIPHRGFSFLIERVVDIHNSSVWRAIIQGEVVLFYVLEVWLGGLPTI